jgi:hypothetical protein
MPSAEHHEAQPSEAARRGAEPSANPPTDGEPRRPHRLLAGLRARRERHRRRHPLLRALVVAAGFVLLVGGAALVVLPGPAFAVIPVALALLALEFRWAERLLERVLASAEAAKAKVRSGR